MRSDFHEIEDFYWLVWVTLFPCLRDAYHLRGLKGLKSKILKIKRKQIFVCVQYVSKHNWPIQSMHQISFAIPYEPESTILS